MGRSAQGVRIFSIDKPDFVIGVDRIVQEESVYRKKGFGGSEAESGELVQAGDTPENQDAPPEPDDPEGSSFEAEPEENRDNETQGKLFDGEDG
jgi:hypothetical protein